MKDFHFVSDREILRFAIGDDYLDGNLSLPELFGFTQPLQVQECSPGLTLAMEKIRAYKELHDRAFLSSAENLDIFEKPKDIGEFLCRKYAGKDREILSAIFLTHRHSCIAFEEIFSGCLTSCPMSPGYIVRRALLHNASAVILAHNHPSGLVDPSEQDMRSTHAVRSAMQTVDIRLLDHIVVAGNQFYSFADHHNM